jgi:hypothetical protein
LVEGEIEFAKFGFQADDVNLNFADIGGGPLLHIGQDFLGRGKIKKIEKLKHFNNYILLKITI